MDAHPSKPRNGDPDEDESRDTGWSARRLAGVAGPAAVVVSGAGVFGSAVLASWILGSWFSWAGNALSHLGAVGRATAPLFNGSLVAAGLLGVVVLAASFGSSGLVGVFSLPHSLHGPVALAYFILLTLGLFVHGTGDVLAGHPYRGLRSIWFGVAHVAGWVLLGFVPFEGIALSELVGAVGVWGWTLQQYVTLRG